MVLALLLATGDDTDVPADGADGDAPEPADSDTADSDTGVPETGTEPDSGSGSAAGCTDPTVELGEDEPEATAGVARSRTRDGIELRVRVSTLLGRDRHPGELAGWGPVHAELARDLIPTLTRGQWRYAITDPRGHLLHAGITRARPTGSAPGTGRTRDVVELQIPATLLHELVRDTTELGAWAAVLTDLAHQHATAEAGTERFAGDADRRHPGAALRRHLQIRDRRCIGPGCRAPARGTDQDHTLDHTRGGLTLPANLGGGAATTTG